MSINLSFVFYHLQSVSKNCRKFNDHFRQLFLFMSLKGEITKLKPEEPREKDQTI